MNVLLTKFLSCLMGFILFQVSNCLWTLDVTVLVIDIKHAEKKNGQFCCCDDNECEDKLNDLDTCMEKCDLVFNVTVSPCTESSISGPCSLFTDQINNAKKFGDNGYYFIFHFTTSSQAKIVRKC